MAEMIIRLAVDPATGKKNILVKLESDPDALPVEHEQLHRSLVEKLLGRGILEADEVGEVIVERISQADEPAPLAQDETPEGEQHREGA